MKHFRVIILLILICCATVKMLAVFFPNYLKQLPPKINKVLNIVNFKEARRERKWLQIRYGQNCTLCVYKEQAIFKPFTILVMESNMQVKCSLTWNLRDSMLYHFFKINTFFYRLTRNKKTTIFQSIFRFIEKLCIK